MTIEKEPIWIRRMAVGFAEWNKRFRENPELFLEMSQLCDDERDGYSSAKYFDSLLRELDDEGKLPKK